MKKLTNLAILFILIFSFGCKKEDVAPVAPVITFLDASLSPDKDFSIVRFEFFDGDGDLGLKQDENSGEQEFNLFVDYFAKESGVWVKKTPFIIGNTSGGFDTLFLHARIPFIENEADGELEGETSVDLIFDFAADTFRYEIYIKDRAFQQSNTITTSELVAN